jgi:hypothetical protein
MADLNYGILTLIFYVRFLVGFVCTAAARWSATAVFFVEIDFFKNYQTAFFRAKAENFFDETA